MEKRENALREALDQNDKEVEQWTSFVEENETAINNMNMFSKMFTVDVMVPFGKKAYFPGKIVHTNEVLVAHYQDYFSECSAHTAIEICKQRIENGKKRLADLEGEKDLFQNKLDKPYHDGVLPTENEREIIEEYDEEKERIWREQHRQRVKEAKLKEKEEREEMFKKIKTQEFFQLSDDEDLLEDELNEELNEPDDDQANQTNELLNKIISGEMQLPPPKTRIAHNSSNAKQSNAVKLDPVKVKSSHTSNETMIRKLSARIESLKVTNNNQSEAEPALNKTDKIDEDDENDSDNSSSEIPEEIQLMEKQAQFLPQQDRFGFYQYQLQIVDQKIAQCKFTNSKELEEKLHLFKIRDHLEELIEDALPLEQDDSESNVGTEVEPLEAKSEDPPKRKISFSKENQILEFRNDESVSTMLPSNSAPKEYIPVRDIIKLDDPVLSSESQEAKEPNENKISQQPVVKRKTILEKVEENIKNNNLEDADLVNKIIDSSVNKTQTIFIKFKHSASLGLSQGDSAEPEIPSTPADFYTLFKKIDNIDPVTETDNNFYLKESDRERAYVDVRSEFLRPKTNILEDGSKSILKNKSAVRRETHVPERGASETNLKKKVNRPKEKEEEDFTSAFDKVMGDVVESTAPDPLPEGKFVDMHAPKKRESRFKQSRNT